MIPGFVAESFPGRLQPILTGLRLVATGLCGGLKNILGKIDWKCPHEILDQFGYHHPEG